MTGQSFRKPTSKPLGDTLLGLFFWGGPPQGPGEATLRQHRTARCTSSAPRSRHCVGAAIAPPPCTPRFKVGGLRGVEALRAGPPVERVLESVVMVVARTCCPGRHYSTLRPGVKGGGEVTESHDVYTESESTPSSPSPTEPGQY